MKSNNIRFVIFIVVSFLVSASAGLFLLENTASAQTVATSSQPNIQMYATATSSTTIIASPAGYDSKVITVYDGNGFRTFATSTPLTENDIQTMKASVQYQESAMVQLFQAEQTLFNQQQQMFQSLWNNAGIGNL